MTKLADGVSRFRVNCPHCMKALHLTQERLWPILDQQRKDGIPWHPWATEDRITGKQCLAMPSRPVTCPCCKGRFRVGLQCVVIRSSVEAPDPPLLVEEAAPTSRPTRLVMMITGGCRCWGQADAEAWRELLVRLSPTLVVFASKPNWRSPWPATLCGNLGIQTRQMLPGQGRGPRNRAILDLNLDLVVTERILDRRRGADLVEMARESGIPVLPGPGTDGFKMPEARHRMKLTLIDGGG